MWSRLPSILVFTLSLPLFLPAPCSCGCPHLCSCKCPYLCLEWHQGNVIHYSATGRSVAQSNQLMEGPPFCSCRCLQCCLPGFLQHCSRECLQAATSSFQRRFPYIKASPCGSYNLKSEVHFAASFSLLPP
ncbi:uncharacterized protein BJ212DRAFT_144574 [Suillus subaureus]|uniref:Secreted protein n=1 Tax=Suillus subaureus TaxID=48587 RepID=A0A9P7J326_9AGAM|nr:uncharacterized protein BJ212DRAFT_144574 [Suillus subaureus]KAG1799961.1 hypothetical protein BJ212DRAFT_144574 [Suillus subaureus]